MRKPGEVPMNFMFHLPFLMEDMVAYKNKFLPYYATGIVIRNLLSATHMALK